MARVRVSQTVLVVASLALGFGAGFFHPIASAVVADISSMENRGRAFGFFRFIRDFGIFAGPATTGIITNFFGVGALFTFSAGLLVVGAYLAMFVLRETHVKGSEASARSY